jgi:hypothetical protein
MVSPCITKGTKEERTVEGSEIREGERDLRMGEDFLEVLLGEDLERLTLGVRLTGLTDLEFIKEYILFT